MPRVCSLVVVALVSSVLPFGSPQLAAQDPGARVSTPACGADGIGKKAIVIDAQELSNQKTCARADNKGQGMPPFEYRNRTGVDVVLYNIDPFLQSCTVTTRSAPVVENYSGVASVLGITLPGSSAAAAPGSKNAVDKKASEAAPPAPKSTIGAKEAGQPAPPPPPPDPTAACKAAFKKQNDAANDLSDAIKAFQDLIESKVKDAQDKVNAYNMLLDQANAYTPKDWSAIRKSAQSLALIDAAEPTLKAADLSGLSAGASSVLSAGIGKSYTTVATMLAQEADTQRQDLKLDAPCTSDAALTAEYTKDQQFLSSVYTDMNGSQSVESTMKAQIAGIATIASALSQAKAAMLDTLGKPGAIRQVHTISGADTDQNTVAVTLTCADHDLGLQRIDVQQASSTGSAKPAASTTTSVKAAKPPNSTAPAGSAGTNSQTATFNISFGEGPRVALTGGFAVAPLVTHIYSTTSATSSSTSGPARTSATSTATNTIVDTSDSSTRIAPLGMVNVRMLDLENEFHQKQLAFLIPNYLTFGITAQGDSNKGATIAYLMGPSIASPGKNLFLTVGAFAATVEHLESGLAVGSSTTLSAANLPITQQYHWKLGFALSYKIK